MKYQVLEQAGIDLELVEHGLLQIASLSKVETRVFIPVQPLYGDSVKGNVDEGDCHAVTTDGYQCSNPINAKYKLCMLHFARFFGHDYVGNYSHGNHGNYICRSCGVDCGGFMTAEHRRMALQPCPKRIFTELSKSILRRNGVK